MEVQSETINKKKSGGKKGGKKNQDSVPDIKSEPEPELEPESDPTPVNELQPTVTIESETKIEGENILNKLTEEEVTAKLNEIKQYVEKISVFTKELKDIELSKDILKEIVSLDKELKKNCQVFSNTLTEILVKECNSSIKLKNSKKTKKEKSTVNKENYAVNKKSKPLPFVTKFMEIDDDAEISPGDLLRGINDFIKIEKKIKKNPEIIVEGENSKFKVFGKLKVLFDSVHAEMKVRSDPGGDAPFPKELRYKDIMKYNKFCFPPKEKK
jgi:hypothetical protein